MSKHPIPDWLRSQFSRIEDEVHKLGPCGVFTQMRTVTQTYFEQAAAAQPPALGGEPEVMGYGYKDECTSSIGLAQQGNLEPLVRLSDHRASLQAEIDRLKDGVRWKAVADEQMKVIGQTKAQNAELNSALAGMVEYFPEGHSDGECFSVERARAALSKPAGSEQV